MSEQVVIEVPRKQLPHAVLGDIVRGAYGFRGKVVAITDEKVTVESV